jgi:nitrogen regulatory protein PII
MNQKHQLITCIFSKGIAMKVVEALKSDKGIIATNVNNARGVGKITPLAYRGIGGQSEKEIINIVVERHQADDIFEYIYHKADINRPHGGLMYMCQLQNATPFLLPDLPDEN